MARAHLAYRSQGIPALLRCASAVGEPLHALEREFGLPRDAHAHRELVLPLETAQVVPDAIASLLGDDLLGAHVAASLPRGAYGLMEFILRNASTLRDFCERSVRHARLLDALTICTFEERGGEALLSLRIPGQPRCFGRQGNELALTFVTRLLFDSMPEGWRPRRAWMSHDEPAQSRALAAILRTDDLAFAAGSVGIAFEPADLDLPLCGADGALLAVLEEQVERRLAEGPPRDDLRGRIEEQVRRVLARGTPRLEQIAPALGMSTRTLQRRLEDAGFAFQDLVDELRRDLALVHLADRRRSIAEVGFMLGYQDPGSFVRAFRRWTGIAPSVYRRRARA